MDETLASVARQDYPALSTVVISSSGSDDTDALAERAHPHLPEAQVHCVGEDVGFGSAANEILPDGLASQAADAAPYVVFCHDDVVLDRSTIRVLVETALQCDAQVVGPKLVDWDDPHWVLQLGITSTGTGAPVGLVERGEIDQGQHDGIREVFGVPGGVTLVRTSVFRRVGGYDETISVLGDDISLCWRARLAGARVIVTSGTRARHREALAESMPLALRERLAARHRLRTVLTCYGRWARWRAVATLLLITLASSVGALLTGNLSRASGLLGAWPWNLRRGRSVWVASRQVRRFRRVSDHEIRQWQVPGRTLLGWWLRRDDLFRARARRALPGSGASGSWGPWSVAAVGVLVAVLVLGSRHLLTRGVPQVGQLVPLGDAGSLWHEWLAGWRRTGLGSDAPVPALLGALGALGTVIGGHMGLLRTVLTVGMVPLGVLGAFHAARFRGSQPSTSAWPGVAAAVAYTALPLPYQALADGRWDVLATYGAAPWVLSGLMRTLRTTEVGGSQRSLVEQILWLGLVTGALALLVPAAPILVVTLALLLGAGSALAFERRQVWRLGVVAAGAAAVSCLLHLPWTLAALRAPADWEMWWGLSRGDDAAPGVGMPLDLTGSVALWALLGGAGLGLLVAKEWRLSWAVRGWVVAAGLYGLVTMRQAGAAVLTEVPLPDGDLLLALAGAGMSLAVGCSAAAAEHDVFVRGYRWFGPRKLAGVALVAAVAVASYSAVELTVDGDWGMPRDRVSQLAPPGSQGETQARTLWVGSPDVVPGDPWRLRDGLTYTTAWQGYPTAAELLAGPRWGATPQLHAALERLIDGETARIGHVLAPMAVETIAVPVPATSDAGQVDHLLSALASQLDLQRVAVDESLVLYRNTAFSPAVSAVWAPEVIASPWWGADGEGVPPADAVMIDGPGPSPAGLSLAGPGDVTRLEGEVVSGRVVTQAVTGSPRWRLTVDGVRAAKGSAFGWANGYAVTASGKAELTYLTPLHHKLLTLAQGAVLLVAVGALVMLRRRRPVADLAVVGTRQRVAVAPRPPWVVLPIEDAEYVRLVNSLADPDIDPVRELVEAETGPRDQSSSLVESGT